MIQWRMQWKHPEQVLREIINDNLTNVLLIKNFFNGVGKGENAREIREYFIFHLLVLEVFVLMFIHQNIDGEYDVKD